jgi:hypothetical protein
MVLGVVLSHPLFHLLLDLGPVEVVVVDGYK